LTKVLIADDDPLMRHVLVYLVSSEDDFEVIGEAQDGEEAIKLTRLFNPDVILMDSQMPHCNGLEATRIIKSEFPETRVIILTIHSNGVKDAIQAGANKFLLKDSPPEILFSAMRE